MLTGTATYPHNALELLQQTGVHLKDVPAFEEAEALGNSRAQNICLLGALIKVLQLEGVDWPALVARFVPEKARELNLRAFQAGFSMV